MISSEEREVVLDGVLSPPGDQSQELHLVCSR